LLALPSPGQRQPATRRRLRRDTLYLDLEVRMAQQREPTGRTSNGGDQERGRAPQVPAPLISRPP
jgi:hypothetical protein